MMVQITAASLVAESRALAMPASIGSIPTDANQEDFVPMGMAAAWKAQRILLNAQRVVGAELLCAAQGLEFLKPLAPGREWPRSTAGCARSTPGRSAAAADRPPAPDLERLAQAVAAGELDPGTPDSAAARGRRASSPCIFAYLCFAESSPYLHRHSPISAPSRMNLEKLKDSARKFEQKEDWRKAIDVYLKAIQQIESGAESSPDLSLYNRVGDLYLKINDTPAAVRSYERAVDLYADQGFFNNAIALCGKILRVNPGRTQTYLKLAQLHARKNVVIEAKRNLIEFLERMNALGQLDPAFQSVKEFADQFSGQPGNPPHAGRIAPGVLARGRGAGAASEAGRRHRGPRRSRRQRGGLPRGRRTTESEGVREPEPPPLRPRGGLVFLDTGARLRRDPAQSGRDPRPSRPGAAAVELTEERWSRCPWTGSSRPTRWTSPRSATSRCLDRRRGSQRWVDDRWADDEGSDQRRADHGRRARHRGNPRRGNGRPRRLARRDGRRDAGGHRGAAADRGRRVGQI